MTIRKKVSAIIQARMGSARLPNKVLMDIESNPLLWHVINRLGFSKEIDEIILAIPDTKENDVLEQFAKQQKIKYFKGSENDVLSRYHQAAEKFACEVVVRVCADRVAIDPEITDLVIKKHLIGDADYTSNTLKPTFPAGQEVEVFNINVLQRAESEGTQPYQREHVTPYIYLHPEIFNLQNIEAEGGLRRPEIRLTVDTKEDFELVSQIYKHLYRSQNVFDTKAIINLLDKYPELKKINSNIKQKSLDLLRNKVSYES